jgi:hypothetical protein
MVVPTSAMSVPAQWPGKQAWFLQNFVAPLPKREEILEKSRGQIFDESRNRKYLATEAVNGGLPYRLSKRELPVPFPGQLVVHSIFKKGTRPPSSFFGSLCH